MLRTRLTRLTPSVLAKCRILARELEGLPNRTAREQALMEALWLVVSEGPNAERVLGARQLMSAVRVEP